ncbi:MAG: hypothetical protein ABWX83_14045 [Luteibacter sp.]|jgi:hypothetical protein
MHEGGAWVTSYMRLLAEVRYEKAGKVIAVATIDRDLDLLKAAELLKAH